MDINKALELGLEWAEKRMASELTKMDKDYILIGIKASLVKNCSIPNVVGRSEQLICCFCGVPTNRSNKNIKLCHTCQKRV